MPRLSDLIARKSQAEMTLADLMRPATVNPLMAAKAQRQEQAIPRVSLAEIMNYPQTWQQFGDNIQANYPTDSPAAVRQAAFEAAKNAGPLMTVWQGSPHRFAPTKNNPLGEFDATKIGSGEGAQAYGYGHYVAEAPSVAKTYRTVGSDAAYNRVTGGMTPMEEFAYDMAQQGFKGEDLFAKMSQRYGSRLKTDADFDAFNAAIKNAEKSRGHLYKVDLPDEHIGKMLDWDKPLSQQPESVRKALQPKIDEFVKQSMHGEDYLDAGKWIPTREVPGSYLLNYLSRTLGGNDKASAYLRDAGIPGIRYLDGGSRGAGQGTSNFVVFPGNEGILKILARE